MFGPIKSVASDLAKRFAGQGVGLAIGLVATLGLIGSSLLNVPEEAKGHGFAYAFGKFVKEPKTFFKPKKPKTEKVKQDEAPEERGWFSRIFGDDSDDEKEKDKTGKGKKTDKARAPASITLAKPLPSSGGRNIRDKKSSDTPGTSGRGTRGGSSASAGTGAQKTAPSSTGTSSIYDRDRQAADAADDNYYAQLPPSMTGGDGFYGGDQGSDNRSSYYSGSSSGGTSSTSTPTKSSQTTDTGTDTTTTSTIISPTTTTTEETGSSSGGSTSSTTNTSGSGSSGGYRDDTTDTTPPTVSVDKGAGTYAEALTATLTSSESGTIYYCLQQNTCCNPMTEGQIYSAPISIGSSNGTYCLSFKATDNAGISSELNEVRYVIDDSLPNANVTYSATWLQTGDLSNFVSLSSSNMGSTGFSFFQLNLGANQPLSSCQATVDTYPYEAYGMRNSEGSLIADFFGRAPASYIEIPLLPASNLDYGSNFIVSVIQNINPVDHYLYSCPSQLIILRDFTLGESLGVNPVTTSSTSSYLQGSFQSFDGGNFGSGNNIRLQSGFFSVVK